MCVYVTPKVRVQPLAYSKSSNLSKRLEDFEVQIFLYGPSASAKSIWSILFKFAQSV